jgi:predicted flap endonuclease-1-like 5' DNA nuclease
VTPAEQASKRGRDGASCLMVRRMTTELESLPRIAAPAARALRAEGYTTLAQLAGVSRAELAKLHGMGPKALRIIDEALARHGLSLD